MIVVDTSIWIDLFRFRSEATVLALRRPAEPLLMHEFVVGELALGDFRDRSNVFRWLRTFRKAPVASPEEVHELIDKQPLYGTGIGYVDAHLLASTLLVEDGRLWSRDRRLATVAERLGIRASME